jgi:hypothetical protein
VSCEGDGHWKQRLGLDDRGAQIEVQMERLVAEDEIPVGLFE